MDLLNNYLKKIKSALGNKFTQIRNTSDTTIKLDSKKIYDLLICEYSNKLLNKLKEELE